MALFSSSPQIHLPGQLLTPPANSQDEDLVTLASNRSRFIDMWCWLSSSGAAVHSINFNYFLMLSTALQIPKCLSAPWIRSVFVRNRVLSSSLSFFLIWMTRLNGNQRLLTRGHILNIFFPFKLLLPLSEISKE